VAATQLVRAWRPRPSPAAAAHPTALPENVRSARVQGITMRWEEHGLPTAHDTVVLLHGLPTSPRLWRYVMAQVQRPGMRCLAWELVGYGGSLREGLGHNISVARQAEYLRFWLAHLGIERAIFVGHDIGGGVAQRLAVLYPEVCAGLVLVDSVAYDNWPVAPVAAARKVTKVLERTPPKLVARAIRRGIEALGDQDDAIRRTSARLHAAPYARPEGPAALAHQLRSVNPLDTLNIVSQLPELRVPARVVWGEDDLLSLDSGEQLAHDLRARLLCIAHAGHYTPEDHPGTVARAINQVLTEAHYPAAAARPFR
jgi:pimeloyl-ACP methyl ester carboxylesterase